MREYQTVLVSKDDGVTTVTFNRPEKRNAMSPQFHRDMYDVLTELEGDDETRVLILTGAGPSFCAGQDLKEYFKATRNNESQHLIDRRISNDWRDRILRMFPKPTIAMVNGYCFGGAFTIVCSCDFAFAADDATFGLSEVNWGSLPGGLVSKVITSTLMFRDAMYYAMTGEPFDGKKAAEMKFINKSVPGDQLRDEVTKLARHLAAQDAAALRVTKESIRQVVDMSYEQAYWWLMAKSNELRWRHDQQGFGGEGIDKFLSKEYRPGFGSFTQAKQKE